MPRLENIEALQQAALRFKARDLEGHLKLYNSSVIHHGFSSRTGLVAGLKDHYNALLKGFPDMRVDIDDIIAEGEKSSIVSCFSARTEKSFSALGPRENTCAPPVCIFVFSGMRMPSRCGRSWIRLRFCLK
jgi:hypothetical protein